MPQTPATQVAVPLADVGQLCPHEPQFVGSLAVLTHAPPQTVLGLLQTHLPLLHVKFGPQVLPQAPQLLGSLLVLMHAPLHTVPAQAHEPFLQVKPVAQAVPHAPQFDASLLTLVQVPLQHV
jgi:hypothetical protein